MSNIKYVKFYIYKDGRVKEKRGKKNVRKVMEDYAGIPKKAKNRTIAQYPQMMERRWRRGCCGHSGWKALASGLGTEV